MKRRDSGISELTDEFLLIGLLVAIAVLIVAASFGLFGFLQKSAYVVPDFSFKNVSGHSVIAVFHRAGDPVYFTSTANDSFQAGFYVDTITGSYPAKPVPSLTGFGPGQTVYIYYTGSGFAAATNLSGVTFPSLPPGILNLRLVDLNTHVLIAQMNATAGATGTGTAATATPTGNVTSNVTTAATTTATPTATPSSYTISVSWTPKATGGASPKGTVTPPGTNDSTVTVAFGSSVTFTVTPASGSRVVSVTLDGTPVSSGGSQNQTITYTLSNVQANHTLMAHFA